MAARSDWRKPPCRLGSGRASLATLAAVSRREQRGTALAGLGMGRVSRGYPKMTTNDSDKGCGLAEALGHAQRAIPGCIAAALVDLRLGVLLSSAASDGVSELLGLTATAMSELFRRSSASAVDDAFSSLKGADPGDAQGFREIFVVSAETVHVFQRHERDPDMAFLAICRGDVNLGMVLARARCSFGDIHRAVAGDSLGQSELGGAI